MTRSDAALHRTYLYLFTSVVLLVLQCGFSTLWPAQGWITCAGLGSQFILGATYCIDNSSDAAPGLRRKWLLTALSFVLWALAFGFTWWGEYIIRFTPDRAWAGDILFASRSLPLLLAACWPEDDSLSFEQWIDFAEITLIAVLLMLLLFPGLTLRHDALLPPLDQAKVLLLLDSANGILAVIAVIACFAPRSFRAWAYQRALAVFLCMYSMCAAFTNRVVILRWDVPAGSRWFLLGSLSITLFLVSFTFRSNSDWKVSRGRQEIGQAIRVGSTVVYALVTFLLSVALTFRLQHATAGVVLGVLSLLLYAVRTALMQLRHTRAQAQLADLNGSLQELSESDPLTGSRNRRWFTQYAVGLWSSPPTQFPLTMLLIDVDYFKKFNDRHGHTHGDGCLLQVAGVLVQALQRHGGVLARYGGEEFAVLLPGTSMAAAHICAQETCASVQAAQIPHPGSPFGVVTVSVGVTTFLQPAPVNALPELEGWEMMFLLADAALYEAKRLGRNRAHAIHTV